METMQQCQLLNLTTTDTRSKPSQSSLTPQATSSPINQSPFLAQSSLQSHANLNPSAASWESEEIETPLIHLSQDIRSKPLPESPMEMFLKEVRAKSQ